MSMQSLTVRRPWGLISLTALVIAAYDLSLLLMLIRIS